MLLEGLHEVQSLLALRNSYADEESPWPDEAATDGAAGVTFVEFMRSATIIAQYGLEAGKRRSASPAKIRFAAMMIRLWGRGAENGTPGPARLSDWWEQGFVTQRMFLPKRDIPQVENDRPYVAAAAVFLDGLAEQAGELGRSLERISTQATELTGYSGVREATRANLPWIALENMSHLRPQSMTSVVRQNVRTLPEQVVEPLRPEELLLDLPNTQDWLSHSDTPYIDELSPIKSAPRSVDSLSPRDIDSESTPSTDSILFPVWFGTNRKRAKSATQPPWYTSERDEPGSLHLGRCLVHIPPNLPFGTVAAPWWRHLYSIKAWNQKMRIFELKNFDNNEEFTDALKDAVAETDDRSILLYIHGYNTKFINAVVRAAQIGHDLDIRGQMAVFSWPSRGNLHGYIADQNRADASEASLEKYIQLLATSAGATRINIIAHSMGNRVFSRVVSKLEHLANAENIKLGIVILAAPDVDRHTFGSLASAFPTLSENTTMYVSSKDKALWLSGHLQSFERAGHTPPISIHPGIDTIQVGNLDVSFLGLGHNYYAETHPVLYDMASLLQGNTNPDHRIRLKQVLHQESQNLHAASDPQRYWQLRR